MYPIGFPGPDDSYQMLPALSMVTAVATAAHGPFRVDLKKPPAVEVQS